MEYQFCKVAGILAHDYYKRNFSYQMMYWSCIQKYPSTILWWQLLMMMCSHLAIYYYTNIKTLRV